MKLQKATRYGLYAVLELAARPDDQLSATDIAATYGISGNHLAKVLRDLGRAGLVESARGAGGGYRFAGNARRVTLLDVINVFEDIAADSGTGDGAHTEIGQALELVSAEIDDIARATFGSITVETLLNTMRWRQEREARRRQPADSGVT